MISRMQGFERDTLRGVLKHKLIWLIHVVINALLFLAFFYWLQIKEETGFQFALTVIGGAIIAFLTLWLHSSTFDFFHDAMDPLATKPPWFRVSARETLRRLPAFLVWTIIFAFMLWLVSHLWTYDEQIGGWARHAFPEFLRRQVTPRSVISAATGLVGFIVFFVWPILALPVGMQVASKGFRGFFARNVNRPARELRFWGVYVVCFLVGCYLPYKLAWWTPTKASALSSQTASMIIRFGVAYLLIVTAWLVICAAIAHAMEAENSR
jgi:hypothetical protein